jgi:DNA-binding phage protein
MPKSKSLLPEMVDLMRVKQQLAGSMRRRKITVAGLAKELGTGRTAVRRTLDVNNSATTFKTIQRTARALGYRVTLAAQPLTPADLGAVARKMVAAKSSAEGDRLATELMQGFYGDAAREA